MTTLQQIATVLILAAATVLMRFLPFIVFSSKRPVPRVVSYLGKVLPPAIFSMLVVFCLRNTPIAASPHGIPEAAAMLVTAGVHLWKRQTLLSILAGTACYMLLLQLVF